MAEKKEQAEGERSRVKFYSDVRSQAPHCFDFLLESLLSFSVDPLCDRRIMDTHQVSPNYFEMSFSRENKPFYAV